MGLIAKIKEVNNKSLPFNIRSGMKALLNTRKWMPSEASIKLKSWCNDI